MNPGRARVAVAVVALAACGGERARPPADAAPPPVAIDAAVPPPPPARAEHPAFSLGDNLPTAHRLVADELVVDGGSVALARYTRLDRPVTRWLRGQVRAGHRVAVARRGGALELPLTATQAAAARGLVVELVAERAGEVRVRVGGRPAGTVAVEPGRHAYPIATAPGAWQAGENQVSFGGEVALASLRVTADPGRAAADPSPTGHVGWDAAGRLLSLDADAGLAWYLLLPAAAAVVAEVREPGCRIDVEATADDGAVVRGALAAGQPRVELDAVGGRPVRLALAARGCARATLVAPALAVPGVAPAEPPRGPPARYVVLWVMDALRADRVRPFTPGARALVPHFEALGAGGAVFRQHYVGGNESQVSHASMWTSAYPAVHDVRSAGIGGSWKLPRKLPALGELIAAAGLTPIAVTGNGFVTDVAGYGRGFVEYRNMMREKGVINGTLFGEHVLAHALSRLEALRDQPLMVFIGTVDTHGPWIARKPWIDTYSPGYRGPFERFATAFELGIVQGQMGCSKIPAPREIERLRAIYDSAVSYHDARLGDLVAGLEKLGILDQTLIVVTADHGEELFEDTRCGHGGSLRESLVRVPLLLHYPARIPPSVIEVGSEGIDVLPTILDAIGAEAPPGLQGQSLIPLAAGRGSDWPRPSYASQYEYAHTMRIGTWKLKLGIRGEPRLIELAADPDERGDVAGERPVARRALVDALGLFLATRTRWHKATMGVVTNLAPGAAALLEGER